MGISAMAVFVSFNGGHNYFKFQSYGTVTHKINVLKPLNRFLTVNEKDKFERKLSHRVSFKKKALSRVCSSSIRLSNEKPAKIQTKRKH